MAPLTDARPAVHGTVFVPGDTFISHRALVCAALATGTSRLRGIRQSAEVESTARALRAFGANIPPLSDDITIQSDGAASLVSPIDSVDCGESGTTAALIAGVAAGLGLPVLLTGDASLIAGSMRRIAEPLTLLGAEITLAAGDLLPMHVSGRVSRDLDYRCPVRSARVKSAILLAALCARTEVTVREPSRSRDHMERLLAAHGVEVWVNDEAVLLFAEQQVQPLDLVIPGDTSSASCLAALAALAPSGALVIRRVCVNDTRTGFLATLAEMGAEVSLENRELAHGEFVADVRVTGGRALHGVEIPAESISTIIDELPLLAVVAAAAEGATVIRGASALPATQSRRLAVIVSNLRRLGASVEELPDSLTIGGSATPLAGRVITGGDHRIATAFGILGADPRNQIELDDESCVDISWPGFWQTLREVTG